MSLQNLVTDNGTNEEYPQRQGMCDICTLKHCPNCDEHFESTSYQHNTQHYLIYFKFGTRCIGQYLSL